MRKRIRRPKYHAFIRVLENDHLYSPAAIADRGKEFGLFPKGLSRNEEIYFRKGVRQSMSRFSIHLPEQADGFIKAKNQGSSRAWFGWRWKKVLLEK